MPRALVADIYFLRSGFVTTATIGRARVDSVPVVDTAACRVAFDELDTHNCEGDGVDMD